MEIESGFGSFKWISNNNTIPREELFFIRMLKTACEKIDFAAYGDINSSDVIYFKMPENNFILNNCYEVDISAAYWSFAKDFLPKDIYERGLTVSKQTRLTALGALAKTTSYIDFDGKDFIYRETISEETKSLFFYCAKKTSEVMKHVNEIVSSPIFFWVDAIFVSDIKDVPYIHSVLQFHNLSGKNYFCEEINSNEISIDVHSKQHYEEQLAKGKKDVKPYRSFFKKKTNSSQIINRIINERKKAL